MTRRRFLAFLAALGIAPALPARAEGLSLSERLTALERPWFAKRLNYEANYVTTPDGVAIMSVPVVAGTDCVVPGENTPLFRNGFTHLHPYPGGPLSPEDVYTALMSNMAFVEAVYRHPDSGVVWRSRVTNLVYQHPFSYWATSDMSADPVFIRDGKIHAGWIDAANERIQTTARLLTGTWAQRQIDAADAEWRALELLSGGTVNYLSERID